MYKSKELHIQNECVVNSDLRNLLDLYSQGKHSEILCQLVKLLFVLISEANENCSNYEYNNDIAICAIAIVDSKYRLGQYQDCLNTIQQYCDAKYFNSNRALPELLRGWCCLVLSRHGQAEEIARNFLQSNLYCNDPEVAASFLFLLGKSQYVLNKYNDARQHYADSLALYRYAGNIEHSCAVLCALGLIEKEIGSLSKSIEYYNQADSYVLESIYKDRAADICLNKAIAFLKHGNNELAYNTLEPILSQLSLPKLTIAKSAIVHARILVANHFFNDAAEKAHSALSMLTDNKYLREEVICLETCGDIELNRSKYSVAQMYYDRAEQIAKVVDNSSDLVGGILMRKARLQVVQANYAEGLEIGKNSLSILEHFGIRYELGVLYRIMSESYMGLLNFQTAYKYSLKSIAILLKHEAMYELAVSYFVAATICFKWHSYYQNSSPNDAALAALVIESYNMIAFDNRTLYEAAWNNALEAHSIFSNYGNKRDLVDIEILFNNIKSLRHVEPHLESISNKGNAYYNNTLFVSYSKSMRSLLSLIEISASTNEPVLITGETGTGKELVARIIHDRSERGGAPFVPVNCAAIPEHLFEREFFGNVKGAYTGADTSAAGLSDQADGGTLFLDEIGELPLMLQAKLLRILQDGSYHRLGDPALRRVNIRILAATNADINVMVAAHTFRPDCYYRLKTIEIQIPPLRERREDIEPLATLFISKMLGDHYTPRDVFDEELFSIFYKYPWPGNVRELESVTKRLALFAKHSKRASLDMLPKYMQQYAPKRANTGGALKLVAYMNNAEKERIMQALISSGGSRTIAARNLGISRKALYAKMKRLQLEFPI